MKIFEISKKAKNGKRKFKVSLHEIYDDKYINEAEETCEKYNENGISWIEKYCKEALPTLKGKSIRVEFLDDDRVEILGHGETGVEDGMATFADATMIGHFTGGYIDNIDIDGVSTRVAIGVGEFDEACYGNFIKKLEEDLSSGFAPHGSVEIQKLPEEEAIGYLYGYKDTGRIPCRYEYSGFALLSPTVKEADFTSKLLELNNKNNKEDKHIMNDMEIKNLVEQTVASMTNHVSEINQIKAECDKAVAEINEKLSTSASETAELTKSLEEANNTISELNEQINKANEKIGEYEKALDEAKAKERVGELNSAIASFSDEEKEYAKAEIDAFNADPITSEINSVVSKIWEGIGKKAKEDAVVAEQNSVKQAESIEDIFAPIDPIDKSGADIDIFG